MSDLRDRLEEYCDGLLDDGERRELEEALARDPSLREELERVRRFASLLAGTHDARATERSIQRVLAGVRRAERPRRRLIRLAWMTAAAAAAVVVAVQLGGRGHDQQVVDEVAREWALFGRRLGLMAAERRAGRVPRTGVGDLEPPPARAAGIVFENALAVLDVPLDGDDLDAVKDMVRDHFVGMRAAGDGLEAQARRSESSLALYRALRNRAGRAVAEAYYDAFRPGLATPATARRVQPGSLAFVVRDRLGPQAGERYHRGYSDALSLLRRRYGRDKLELVLGRLAPNDRRLYFRDAAQDGVGRDAVLAIRAHLYRTALETGADRLYVELS